MRQNKLAHIMGAIEGERVYQVNKWGDNPHELPGWLLIMQAELDEAKQAWCKSGGNEEALKEVLQVIAVGVACLEQHGIATRFGQGIRWGQEEKKPMTIHPAGTPLSRVAIGEAIVSLPRRPVPDIVTIPAQDGSQLEFVRFLTERDGQRIHVWKRTR